MFRNSQLDVILTHLQSSKEHPGRGGTGFSLEVLEVSDWRSSPSTEITISIQGSAVQTMLYYALVHSV